MGGKMKTGSLAKTKKKFDNMDENEIGSYAHAFGEKYFPKAFFNRMTEQKNSENGDKVHPESSEEVLAENELRRGRFLIKNNFKATMKRELGCNRLFKVLELQKQLINILKKGNGDEDVIKRIEDELEDLENDESIFYKGFAF
ncbi:hypothetical protein GVAV_000799 [Gurleya vavrai]